jgi:hypothetical protein
MRNPLLVSSVLLVSACASTPSPRVPSAEDVAFAKALSAMCDVDRKAGLSPDADPLGVGSKRTAWIAANVDDPNVIELRTYMSVKGAAEQAELLRAKVKEMGVGSCALADSLARTNEGGLAP